MARAVPAADDQTVSLLMRMFRDARAKSNWAAARMALDQLKLKMPGEPFVVQQLALVTYKGKQPDPKAALAEARNILTELNPEATNDPETLGVWGAIHKRMWELDGKREDLDEAIRSYGKGFNLKDDSYNGINYAYVLNVRASVTTEKSEAIADFVWARRVRQRVIELAQQRLDAGVKDDHGNEDLEQKFWLRATLIEALVGTGASDRAEAETVIAIAEAPESWMAGSLQEQLEKLKHLLAQAPV
jgi:hypothetical protein